MAISSVGDGGTRQSSTTFRFPTTQPTTGQWGVAIITCDNVDGTTGDADSATLTSIADNSKGTWTKLAEYTNGNGSSGAGHICAVWLFEYTSGTITSTEDFTYTWAGTAANVAATSWVFSGSNLIIDTGSTIQKTVQDAVSGSSSQSFSGLSSTERLYVRAVTKASNSSTNWTASTSFTRYTHERSGNGTPANGVWGEFRINTSTGETSNPSWTISGDTVELFLAIIEDTGGGSPTSTPIRLPLLGVS